MDQIYLERTKVEQDSKPMKNFEDAFDSPSLKKMAQKEK